MGEQIGDADQGIPPQPEKLPPGPKPVLTREQKLKRFLIGFLGWWIVNYPVWALFGGGYGMIGLITFPANIIVLIILAFRQRWVALGMLAAIAANLLISIMLGVTYMGLCFIPFPLDL
ncbi:MAG: hypothetical protein ACM3QS_14975 [Bacteroidota bacterium]